MARVEQSIEVNVPVHAIYDQLTRFEQYPRFMEDVREVRQLDDTHLHWHTKAGNLDMEWDAEITQQVPDRCIAWRNVNGPLYQGKIELQQTEGERTRLTVTMECDARQQMLAQHGNAEEMFMQRTEQDLARFKKFVEKIARDNGQWSGRPNDARPAPVSARTQAVGEDIGKTVARSAAETRDAARAPEGGAARSVHPQDNGQRSGRPGDSPAREPEAGGSMLRAPWMPGLLHAWEHPLSVMRTMSEDIDHALGRYVSRPLDSIRSWPGRGAWTPPIDVAQSDERFTVCVDLAGVKPEDVQVEVRGDRISIEGERYPLNGQHAQEYRRTERVYGHFSRVVMLPSGADVDGASATLHDGVLEIAVPFARRAQQSRRLEIHTPRQH